MNKFKIGDKVIIYGLVKGTVVDTLRDQEVIIEYDKKIGKGSNRGYFHEDFLMLIEIYESPLFQAMREDNE